MTEAPGKPPGEAGRTAAAYTTDVYFNSDVIKGQYPVYLQDTVTEFKTALLRSLTDAERTAMPTCQPSSYKILLMMPEDELKQLEDARKLSEYDEDLTNAEAIKLELC